MVFNATFNNISVTSWWSVLLTEETGEPGENHSFAGDHFPFDLWIEVTYQVDNLSMRLVIINFSSAAVL